MADETAPKNSATSIAPTGAGRTDSAQPPKSPLTSTSSLTLDDWDIKVLDEFFAPSETIRSVVVCVDETVLERLAPGQGLRSLTEAVEEEVRRLPRGHRNPLRMARQRLDEWMNKGRAGPPPLLGVVAFLVAASDYGGEAFASNSYWHRLQALRETVTPAAEPLNESDRELIEVVFRSLADWAVKEQGRRGAFDLRRVGGMRRIGLVRAQALLSASDRAALTTEFAHRGMHPDASVSRGELVQLAQQASGLRPVTRRLLDRWPDDLNAATLVELVHAHLREWDGTIVHPGGSRSRARLWLSGVLELRAFADGRQTAVVRAEGGRTDDLDGLELRADGTGTWSARFEMGSLSEPLVDPDTNQLLDARKWDWAHDCRFASSDPGAPVAGVFVPGRRFRFFTQHDRRAFVERLALPPSGPCLVACRSVDVAAVAGWARRNLPDAYRELRDAPTPIGWSLLRLDAVPENMEARRDFPGRGFVDATIELLTLVGGERDPSGRYYPFTPPHIEVNTQRSVRVRIASVFDMHGSTREGVRVETVADDSRRLWRLVVPDELWSQVAGVRIEAIDGSESVDSRTLHFSALPSPAPFAGGRIDRWGRYVESPGGASPGASGRAAEIGYDPAYPLGAPDLPSLAGLGPGDRLVQVLWAQRRMSWATAKRVALELYRTMTDAEDEWSFRRGLSFQIAALRALRHMVAVEGENGLIEAMLAQAPRLELLPVRAHSGLLCVRPSLRSPVQALATGSWRRRDLENLMASARRAGVGVHIAAQPTGYWLVPDRVCLQAETVGEVDAFARAHHVEFVQRPAVLDALEELRPPGEFLAHARWQDGEPPSASTSYVFDPAVLGIRSPSTVGGDLVLYECHGAYAERLFTYWLYDRTTGRSACVPRQLGRWMAQAANPRLSRVLPQSNTGVVFTPLELRPPLAVEQAFCSCSGFAPEVWELPGISGQALVDSLSLPTQLDTAQMWHGAQRVRSGYWLGYRGVATSRLRDQRTQQLLGLDVGLRTVSTLFASSLGRTTGA